jgi:hypothetical protein
VPDLVPFPRFAPYCGEQGRFRHPCSVCGLEDAFHGFGVSLHQGVLGTWYCRAHRPAAVRCESIKQVDRATEDRITKWLDAHPEVSPAGTSVHCGGLDGNPSALLPFGFGPHTWLHSECRSAWSTACRAKAVAALNAESAP